MSTRIDRPHAPVRPFGRPLVLGIDAGGTMTDTLLVDDEGNFVVGKAPTTPHDESVGLLESVADALSYVGSHSLEQFFGALDVCLYAGTTMLNTLLSRTGRRIGLITTRGFEDMVHQGRGIQTWTEYSYSDRLHAVTHVHPEPLLPRMRIKGVTERIDVFGRPAIPLREHEVTDAARALLADGVEAICICLLMSYANDAHEQRASELVEAAIAAGRHGDVPIFLSSKVRPVTREVSRANSTLIEAYAAAPVRVQLQAVEDAIRAKGFRSPLQTLLAYGGMADVRYPRLHETLISGPVGGVLAGQFVGEAIGERNLVLSDLGGTSFDLAAITDGRLPIKGEPTIARFQLNLPTIELETIGAGAGTIVRVDPELGKIELGPDSAQADPGPVCFGRGGTRATICDCDLILGYLNPDNFLGGKITLDVEAAADAVRRQITEPLGVDLHEGAEGIVRMLETEARETLRRMVQARGFSTGEYVLLAYGGAGPLHVAGYSHGLGFKDVLTFPYAACFSAFGCTTADYAHRYSRSVHFQLVPGQAQSGRCEIAGELDRIWSELRREAIDDMVREGRRREQITVTLAVSMRYIGQLEDVEVVFLERALDDAEGVNWMIGAWEAEYDRINRRVSRYSEAGHQISEIALIASAPKVKPRIVALELEGPEPPAAAARPGRDIYWDGRWHAATVWDMEHLRPGNAIAGPAVLEHPATTFVVPPGMRTWLDEREIFHLREGAA